MSPLARVIVADLPDGVQAVCNILGPGFSVSGAASVDEAMSALEKGAELVVCGIHFDSSRMFDLLRLVKADSQTRIIPFVCFRDMESALTTPVLEGLQIASTALGAAGFIDLHDLKSKHGVAEADGRFREILVRAMGGESP